MAGREEGWEDSGEKEGKREEGGREEGWEDIGEKEGKREEGGRREVGREHYLCVYTKKHMYLPGLNLSLEIEDFVHMDLLGQLKLLHTRTNLANLSLALLVFALDNKHVDLRELCEPLLAVVRKAEHGAAADDAPHGVGVLDTAHEQLLLEEESRGRVIHLLWVDKPRTMEPRVTTGERGG